MGWKRILGFAVVAFILVMAGALISEIFDIHDTKPFFIDPECLLMLHSCVLVFCVGIMALARRVFSFCMALAQLLPFGNFGLLFISIFQHENFEIEHLLFSPPLSVTSLRI
ncbi:MAG TPA: hypothetical protein VND66_01155 [Acidobacteriaceae bacterium]|nr:hypothetical protein [Terriglobia bacterium]HVC89203.1 hypothetical protein [Acidobacteriaceae bacterium]